MSEPITVSFEPNEIMAGAWVDVALQVVNKSNELLEDVVVTLRTPWQLSTKKTTLRLAHLAPGGAGQVPMQLKASSSAPPSLEFEAEVHFYAAGEPYTHSVPLNLSVQPKAKIGPATEPMVVPPVPPHVRGDDMDYERGLATFKQLAEDMDWYQDFAVYEAPLRENLRDERRYGPSEQSRRDRARLIDQLNALALDHLGISFNDLCMGKQPPSTTQPMKGFKGNGAPVSPEPTYYGTGQAWAVLVGVDHYEDAYIADLKVCVDDVSAIHQSLAGGYQVAKLLTDATPERLPTRANIMGELSAVAQSADEGDLLLFYFSGHGKAEGDESYLLPRDTRLAALKHTAVAMRDVRELIDQSAARAKVIVLDACHSGASIGKAEPTMTPEFIRRVFEEAEGMAVLASCKQGQQSWEWPDKKRSVFTYYLLEALAGGADFDQKGFVTVSDASQYVTDGVKRWAAENGIPQTPTLQYTVAGDIILIRLGVQASS